MASEPVKAIDHLRSLMRAGDWARALALAARWADLGEHKEAIVRGHEARVHAAFYRQLGRDPEALVADGQRALEERYGKQNKEPTP